MMDTHAPRKVSHLTDEMPASSKPPTNLSRLSDNPAKRPLRVPRVFTESDDFFAEASEIEELAPQKMKRRGKIRQLPLHLVGDENIQAQSRPTAAQAMADGAAVEYVADYRLSDLAGQIRKVTTDLLVGAAVATASFAELVGNVLSLLGLAVLIFPGQFVHTCLMALYYRLTAQEKNYAIAFSRCWATYGNIPNAYWQIGPCEIHLSFLVGLSLVSPFLLLKFLELVRVISYWFKL